MTVPASQPGGSGPALPRKDRMIAGLLAVFLGTLGIHHFYLDRPDRGLIYLVVSLAGGFVTCGLAAVVIAAISLVEGILYMMKSDEEFQRRHG